ncbi:hypothetical protein STEG23_032693, partial [Scotinomys teguina]
APETPFTWSICRALKKGLRKCYQVLYPRKRLGVPRGDTASFAVHKVQMKHSSSGYIDAWVPILDQRLKVIASLIILHSSGATKKGTEKQITSETQKSVQCGTWTKHAEGGVFTSPNYPSKYPPDRECVYIIEAAPRQCIELYFDEKYSIEPSWECKFDHIEVRDGPFGFSPIIGRFCGQQNPPVIKSSGRFLWIKFFADGELESMGFSARYNFTPDEILDEVDWLAMKSMPMLDPLIGG